MSSNQLLIGARIYFAASKNRSYRDKIEKVLRTLALFLQENGLATRALLGPDEEITEEFEITEGDLSEEGREFYGRIEEKWLNAVDRGKDPEDRSMLERELRGLRKAGRR